MAKGLGNDKTATDELPCWQGGAQEGLPAVEILAQITLVEAFDGLIELVPDFPGGLNAFRDVPFLVDADMVVARFRDTIYGYVEKSLVFSDLDDSCQASHGGVLLLVDSVFLERFQDSHSGRIWLTGTSYDGVLPQLCKVLIMVEGATELSTLMICWSMSKFNELIPGTSFKHDLISFTQFSQCMGIA